MSNDILACLDLFPLYDIVRKVMALSSSTQCRTTARILKVGGEGGDDIFGNIYII